YSHGGFLHPYFDKFFNHGNLASIYTPKRYDHAFYLWKYDWLPNLLTLGQVLIITVFMLAYAKRPDEAMKLCGLIYLAYMLFFKGYSTQFAVSTSFYFLLAGGYLALLIPLEISHAIQIISWTYIPQINLRNMHTHLLLSSILIRTIIFTYVLISSLRGRFSDLRETPTIIKRFLIVVKRILSNRRTLMLAAFTIILGYMFVIQVFSHLHQENIFRSISGSIDLSVNKWENVTLSGLERGDKIIVKLYTNTRVETYVIPGVAIERGVRNQYNLRGSFNETILFFRATAEQHTLSFKMAHPKLPFRITDGFNGDLKVTIEGDGTLLKISLVDEGLDGKDSFFRIAYPYESYVEDNFRFNIKYEVVAPNSTMPTIILDLFDETDEWLYAFKITEENFTLTPETPDINGYANLRGDIISLMALFTIIKDGETVDLYLKDLNINGHRITFFAENSETVPYEIYMEKTFKTSEQYIITLLLFTFSTMCTILAAILSVNGSRPCHGN
ncbi:MAG: hypothetical protein QXV37_02640, partial [Candidatus Jordarchaeaceae archaeon]